MNGITGTGMMYFKKDPGIGEDLDVANYVAVTFIGESDADSRRASLRRMKFKRRRGTMIFYLAWLLF